MRTLRFIGRIECQPDMLMNYLHLFKQLGYAFVYSDKSNFQMERLSAVDFGGHRNIHCEYPTRGL